MKDTDAALDYLMRDPLTNQGLLTVLRRGTAECLHAAETGVLLRDSVSGAWMLGAAYCPETLAWLGNLQNCDLLTVTDRAFVPLLRKRCGLTTVLDCAQYVCESRLPLPLDHVLRMGEAAPEELEQILRIYRGVSREELLKISARHTLFAGRDASGRLAGFAGSHLEGSMGLLMVLPEFRGRGYGAELERFLINHFLKNGLTPFCQVERGNKKSEALQEKLRLQKAPGRVYWLF